MSLAILARKFKYVFSKAMIQIEKSENSSETF